MLAISYGVFFFKQETAYEMRISDWSSDVCSSDLDGRGRIECAFFAEAYFEYAQLLTRDRILIVEGGLREDEFSGGFSLRARRCWDFHQVCPQSAKRLSLRLDLRVAGVLDRIEALLAQHRPGGPPLRSGTRES